MSDLEGIRKSWEGTQAQVNKFIGILEGWEIPKFKQDVYDKINNLTKTVADLNHGRIEKMETKIEGFEKLAERRAAISKAICWTGAIVAGSVGVIYTVVLLIKELLK